MNSAVAAIGGELVVSCQVTDDGHQDINNPAQGPAIMAAFASAAEAGGACGIRAEGNHDIAFINDVVDIPIIGINKVDSPAHEVRITPTADAVVELAAHGADIVAVDGTRRREQPLNEFVHEIRSRTDVPIMADISTVAEAKTAAEAGVDLVATTLSGYTDYSRPSEREPNVALMEEIAQEVDVPVVLEGHVATPETAKNAIDRGAHAVVVGSAIVNVRSITKSFVDRISETERS